MIFFAFFEKKSTFFHFLKKTREFFAVFEKNSRFFRFLQKTREFFEYFAFFSKTS